jgi:hypothetical protein
VVWILRSWLNDFRTQEWEKVFPAPELALNEITHLLSLA